MPAMFPKALIMFRIHNFADTSAHGVIEPSQVHPKFHSQDSLVNKAHHPASWNLSPPPPPLA